ncbi:MAG: ABC transporter permease [Planctomycetota bacterium]|jgi:ribose/xylose/arabinose/galactoside ABC-type transport system permease subunit|nr:ABC transporter permease [Planctomycetota bacterium]
MSAAREERPQALSRLDRMERLSEAFYRYGLYIVLLALVVLFYALNSNFLSANNAVNLLLQTSSTGIAAAGLVFVMLTGGIDISISAVMFITAVISTVLTDMGLGLIGAIAVSIACGAVIGAVNGFFIAKLKMTPIIVTLAVMYSVRGLAIGFIGVKTLFFTNAVGAYLVKTRILGYIPLIVVILAVVMALCQILLSRTLLGKQMYAIGNNRSGAQKMGIAVEKRIFSAYVLCGALAGLAGLVSGAQVGQVSPAFAVGQEFIIISAAVLGGVSLFGGKGKAFPGAFLGVLIIMCIENGLVMARTNMYAYTIVRGCVIFVAVMLDSFHNKGETR